MAEQGFSHWLGRRLDWSVPTMPINSKTPQLLPPRQGVGQRRHSLVLSTAVFASLSCMSKVKKNGSQCEKQDITAGGRRGAPVAGRGRRRRAGGGRRAAGWGRRRRRGKGRWRSRGGRSSLFVFVARWLPASHHVTRTRGRRAAPSAAAASRRGPAGSDPHSLAGSPRALLGRPARPPPPAPEPPGT